MVNKIAKMISDGTAGGIYVPVTEQEAESNIFYRDFMSFLEYVKDNSPKLTLTGNLNMKALNGINKCMIRKRRVEEILGEHAYEIRSEYKMPYIRAIKATARIMGLCKKYKKKLICPRATWKKFSVLPPGVKFMLLWECYRSGLNWAYIQRFENEAVIAEILQEKQDYIWLMLRDYDMSSGYGWIFVKHVLETIRKEFNIDWDTVSGDDAGIARWGIEGVIFDQLLKWFDFIEINKETKKFRLTVIGRKVIAASVPLGWGIGGITMGSA